MKNKILLYTAFFSLLSFNSWTQSNEIKTQKEQSGTVSKTRIVNTTRVIKYYHVEEITPLKFGGHKTVYDVRDAKLIQTYDLGPNNRRTVTPVYEDQQVIEVQVPPIKADTLKKIPNAAISISDKIKKPDSYAYIDIIKTYERVSDKGYESIDMLKKVANSYFFNDEMEKAEKSYAKLFSLTANLEPEFYYRYSISLRAAGKTQQADEYMKKFTELSNNKNSK